MKLLGVSIGLALAALVLGVVFLWPAGDAGPEPIAYGRDACARCRMIISQTGFGGEIREQSGKLDKFDDVGCLLETMLAHRAEMPEVWVEDHPTGDLVPLLGATFVQAQESATPMGHGIIAFANAETARRFAAEQAGAIVAFEDLVRDRTRSARGPSSAESEEHP